MHLNSQSLQADWWCTLNHLPLLQSRIEAEITVYKVNCFLGSSRLLIICSSHHSCMSVTQISLTTTATITNTTTVTYWQHINYSSFLSVTHQLQQLQLPAFVNYYWYSRFLLVHLNSQSLQADWRCILNHLPFLQSRIEAEITVYKVNCFLGSSRLLIIYSSHHSCMSVTQTS